MNKNTTRRPDRCIHWKDAIALLEVGLPVDIKVWKLSTGDIIQYNGAICTGGHRRGGTHRVFLPVSRETREFRDITLFEINGYEVIR